MRTEKGRKVDWAHIIFNSLCSELDQWYKYVKENKGDKKDIFQFALILAKIFRYLFVHQKENSHKPPTKVKKSREEMQKTLEDKKDFAIDSPRSALYKKKKFEEGGA
jgi:hypothetical protein